MSLFSLAAIYFIVWWLCFFAVLPWGVKTQAEQNDIVPGTTASAPTSPNLWKKAAATSILAAIVVAIGYWLLNAGLLSLEDLPGPNVPN